MYIAFAVAAAAVGAPGGAGQARAEEPSRFDCRFTAECIGTRRPCDESDPLVATLKLSDRGWVLEGAGETGIAFFRISGPDDVLMTLLSRQSDPAAGAVTLLSVAEDGSAFVSTHGVFLTPEVVTHAGTCRPTEG